MTRRYVALMYSIYEQFVSDPADGGEIRSSKTSELRESQSSMRMEAPRSDETRGNPNHRARRGDPTEDLRGTRGNQTGMSHHGMRNRS